MENFKLEIGKKCFEAKSPTVGNLKRFLRFKKRYEETGGLDEETLNTLLYFLKEIFPGLKDRDLEKLNAAKLIDTAQNAAVWMGEAIGGGEKNL